MFEKEAAQQIEFINANKKLLHLDAQRQIFGHHEDEGKYKILFGTGNHGKVAEFNKFLAVSSMMRELTSELIEFGVLGADYVEIEEDGETFLENCFLKSTGMSRSHNNWGKNILAEDSGICVDVLGGYPGVKSARCHDTEDMKHMIAKLFSEFPNIGRFLDRQATLHGYNSKVTDKNRVDFINKICVIENIRIIMEKASNEIKWPTNGMFRANFVTTASIAVSGKVVSYSSGTMSGHIGVPKYALYGSDENLFALYRDFGYNSIFYVESATSGNRVNYSEVNLDDRLRWNHRSIALSKVIIDFLVKRIIQLRP